MKQVLYLFIYIGLALTMGCTKPDRDDEAVALSTKIVRKRRINEGHPLPPPTPVMRRNITYRFLTGWNVGKMRIALLASYFVQRKIISRLNSH
jgi:hypothetical protein